MFLLKDREENNIKQCKFYHYLPNHYKREQKKIDVEVEKVPVMSVTKRPTPAPLIDFKTSINVSRFLRPSFVWHGSLNIRLFLNDQLPVPD